MFGTIFSIEEFAINDGPGIRTTVFFKGCPLRCQWCHNPEGQEFQPQWLEKKSGRFLSGKTLSSSDLAKELLRNEKIFSLNDGGVTFTGGEPLSQPDFLFETMQLLKGRVHLAIETSAFVATEVFIKAVELADFMLVDCKVIDSSIHKKYTGVDNAQILQNIKNLCKHQTEFVVRIPLIADVNDSVKNMRSVAELLKGAKKLLRVELLTYNTSAGAKYAWLGRDFNPDFDTKKTPAIHDEFSKYNIPFIVL